MNTKPRVADIVAIASRLSGVPVTTILGKNRDKEAVRVRQAVMYVARGAGYSLPQIGARMNRDHSTIVHGLKAVGIFAERDPDYATFLWDLTDEAASSAPFIPLPPAITSIIADKPEPPAPCPDRYLKKPKNDFRAEPDDAGNVFHDGIAQGSQSLIAAIQAARAA